MSVCMYLLMKCHSARLYGVLSPSGKLSSLPKQVSPVTAVLSLNKAQAMSRRIFISQAKPASSSLGRVVLQPTGTVYLTRTNLSYKSWMAMSAPVPLVVHSRHQMNTIFECSDPHQHRQGKGRHPEARGTEQTAFASGEVRRWVEMFASNTAGSGQCQFKKSLHRGMLRIWLVIALQWKSVQKMNF